MADSSYFDDARKWTARKLAELIAEGRDDLPGAMMRYAKGAAKSTRAQIEHMGNVSPMLKPMALMSRLLPEEQGQRSVMPGVTDDRAEAKVSSTAEGLGELMGTPGQPGSGAGGVAQEASKLTTRVFSKGKINAAEGLERAGASPLQIWQRVGVAKHEGQWFQDVGGDPPKMKRGWNPNETTAHLGDLVEWPAAMQALRRYGISDPEKLLVKRKAGEAGGAINSGVTAAGDPSINYIKLGDTGSVADMLESLSHELQHGVEYLQTGKRVGANHAEAVAEYLTQNGNPRGWKSKDDILQARFSSDPGILADASKHYYASWAQYANNPGEQRARISQGYSKLPEEEREKANPFRKTLYASSSGRKYDFDPETDEFARAGLDMVNGKGATPIAQAFIPPGAEVDRLLAPSRKSDKLEDIISELLNRAP